MQETIILAPGADPSELLRMMAKNGKNTIGIRILSGVGLAGFALMRSGKAVDQRYISSREEAAIYRSFLKDIPYFESSSFHDAKQVAVQMSKARSLVIEHELENLRTRLMEGEFKGKNAAILDAFSRYLEYLDVNGLMDGIGMIREAVIQGEELGLRVVLLREYPCTPLERRLAEKVSGGNLQETDILGLLEKEEKPLKVVEYTENYGASNEMENILGYIYEKNLPLDQCIIVPADPGEYSQILLDNMVTHGIPATSGCGFPITSSNPAKLLKLYMEWSDKGYCGIDALNRMVFSPCFDKKAWMEELGLEETKEVRRLVALAGNLRLGPDSRKRLKGYEEAYGKNEGLAKVFETLSSGAAEFIRKFTVIREGLFGTIDRAAQHMICDTIELQGSITDEVSLTEMVPELLKSSVCLEKSKEGHLYMTSIGRALASVRKHVFIAGLSADNFPGKPQENYILLDSDLMLLGEDVPISKNIIKRKKEQLWNLLNTASALDDAIYLSYAGYMLTDIKEENPSAMLFEIYRREHGENATMEEFEASLRHQGFFSRQLTAGEAIGRAYAEGKEVMADEKQVVREEPEVNLDRKFSPTAVETFFECPRKFYLTKLLGLSEPEEDDPFEVISPRDLGTLVHELMETYTKEKKTDDFLDEAAAAFDRFARKRPPIHDSDYERQKQQFMEIMQNAAEEDPGNELVTAEETMEAVHPLGIRLGGRLDRLEKDRSGKYIVVDYKTGRYIRHEEDKAQSCIQTLIYAYILQENGMEVDHCEYRYVRQRETISCRFDEIRKQDLNDCLSVFKEAMENGIFPCCNGDDPCRFCKLIEICGKQEKGEK